MLILNLRLPPSDHAYKQARTVHAYKREPSELLALVCEYWRYSRLRETRAESSGILKSTNGIHHNFRFRLWLIVINHRIGSAAHRACKASRIVLYCLFRVKLGVKGLILRFTASHTSQRPPAKVRIFRDTAKQ